MVKPLEVLHRSLNCRVMVELKGNRGYRGILNGYDIPHMNLVLKNADEIIDGNVVARRETVIVRGDNIVYISP
ncbi:MAG: small nuclear ribonucleoprotein [Thermoplasmata archaeon]|nr:small nuclear ribonucleoprotein [Thermoplasmata archaeon]RLF37387.1 MAG: small nuclear ribonucleoprotein [Thermoplasmata archaeon]